MTNTTTSTATGMHVLNVSGKFVMSHGVFTTTRNERTIHGIRSYWIIEPKNYSIDG